MRRLLPAHDFSDWFDRFLPRLALREPATLFTPALVSDRADGKIAHLDGLNLSRAWCWRSIATTWPASDASRGLALEAAENLSQKGVSVEVVDLRTVHPLDSATVLTSVEKTSRALVLYESHRFLGVGAEVAAMIAEEGFQHLDAPVMRLAPPNVPVPFSPPLEDAYLPQVADIEAAVEKLSAW